MMFGYASIRCTCHVTWHPFYSRLFRFDLQLEIVMKIIRQTMRTMDDVLIIMISVYSMIISCGAISTQKKCKRIARKNKLLIIKYLHNIIFTISKNGVTWHPFYSRLFRFDLQLEIVMKIIRQTMRTMDDVLIIMISVYSMIISCGAISTQKKCKRIARKNKLLIIKYLHNIIFTISKNGVQIYCNSNSLVYPVTDKF